MLLHHTQDDHGAEHVRSYFPESIEVTNCHEEVQQADGNGAVLRYVATYQQKFSGSFAKDWLNDAASHNSVARRVLFSFHLMEPEMWLTLAATFFPQIYCKGTLVDIMLQTPFEEQKKPFVEL